MLQGDGAGLVEARLDVLLAVRDRLVLLDVTLEGSRETGERGMDAGKRDKRRGDRCAWEKQLTFRRIMSISEYFIPFTRIGINLEKKKVMVNKHY